MPRVTLALVGDTSHLPHWPSEEEFRKRWDERPHATLDVKGDESLASIIERALDEFGAVGSEYSRFRYSMVDLVPRRDDERPRIRPLTMVDENGRAIWTAHDLRLVPWSQLAHSIEAGAIEGSPTQIYLVWNQRGGNGPIPGWPDLVEGLGIAWEVVKGLGAAGAAWYAVKTLAVDPLRSRLGRGRDVIARNAHRWDQRGALPYSLAEFIGDRRWNAEDLARLLGCSADEAIAVLETFGHTFDDGEGCWVRGQDEPARLLRLIHEEVSYGLHEDASPATRREFRRRVETILETGERPPPEEMAEEHHYDDWERMERIRGLVKGASLAVVGFMAGALLRRKR